MKHILLTFLCLALLCCAFLCACGDSEPEATVITKASVSLRLPSTTTTTTATATQATAANEQTVPTAGTTTAPSVIAENGSNEKGNAIAQTAISLIGTPFKAGGNGPDAFDNPGFVVYCYKQAGYTVPNRAAAMQSFGQEVALSALQPGDILLFCNDIGGGAQFTGIYIGDNRFVACNNPESPTKAQQLGSGYWSERLLAARRPA